MRPASVLRSLWATFKALPNTPPFAFTSAPCLIVVPPQPHSYRLLLDQAVPELSPYDHT